jgi:integrase
LNEKSPYVFSFRAESSALRLLQRFRLSLVKAQIKEGERFTVKDCRSIAIQDIFEHEGIDAAQKIADHSSKITTLKYYLHMRNDRSNPRGLKITQGKKRE